MLLAEMEGLTEADTYDLLAHLAFGTPIRTRSQRAEAFLNREQAFLRQQREEARRVILELAAGIDQLEPEIFGVSPFREWGGAVKVSDWFGGPAQVGQGLKSVRERLQTRETLANEIWRACDILRRDNNCGGIMEYVEHLSWLLFLRFLDAQEEWETQAAIAGRPYQRIIDPPYRWRDWAARDWPADDLLAFVHGKLIPYLQALGGDPLRETIRSVFAEGNVIVCASGYNLKDVITIINNIDFHSQDGIFTVSQVYEELLRRLGSENRLAGEFYTPRPVVRFIVGVVHSKIGETVYDPACGTCGFLAQAYLKRNRNGPSRITGPCRSALSTTRRRSPSRPCWG